MPILSGVWIGLFSRGSLRGEAQPHKNTVERKWMALVSLIGFKFSIHFQQGDVRVASVQIANPFKLGLGMGIRMRRMRSVRFIGQGSRDPSKRLFQRIREALEMW